MKRSFLDGYSTGATILQRESQKKEKKEEKNEKEASWQIEGGTGGHRYAQTPGSSVSLASSHVVWSDAIGRFIIQRFRESLFATSARIPRETRKPALEARSLARVDFS